MTSACDIRLPAEPDGADERQRLKAPHQPFGLIRSQAGGADYSSRLGFRQGVFNLLDEGLLAVEAVQQTDKHIGVGGALDDEAKFRRVIHGPRPAV